MVVIKCYMTRHPDIFASPELGDVATSIKLILSNIGDKTFVQTLNFTREVDFQHGKL